MNYILIDTETCNDIECPLAYDISWLVFNENFDILEKRSYVVYDTYVLEKELMQSAYYAEKLPQYEIALSLGEKKLVTIQTISNIFASDYYHYSVFAIIGHNFPFDYRSCSYTLRYITKSENRYFFPYGCNLWDTLKMARQVYKGDLEYYRYCNYYDLLCKNGSPRFTAEVIYKFLTDNEDFEEKHIGIDDCLIELEIFKKCMELNPNCEKNAFKPKSGG